MDEVLKLGKPVAREGGEKEFGFPILTATMPLIDNLTQNTVGTFTLAIPRKLAHDLKNYAGSLDAGLTGVSTSMQEIAAATNDISNNQGQLHEEIRQVQVQLDSINDVMAFIKEIADETKMLGLNAAIEAARVGEAGRGFGVVAEEIRKLSAESKKTVAQIKLLTKHIEKSMGETAAASKSTLAVVEETSAVVQEVNTTVGEMARLSNQLMTMAVDL